MDTPYKANCIFCRIVEGSEHSHKIWEDEHSLVFMDLFPASEGHTLLIPKPHWENLFETPGEPLARIIRLSKPIAHALRTVYEPDGLSVFQLNGDAAGQTVFHYHMHLIPRWHGKTMNIHGRGKASQAHLSESAARIEAALEEPRLEACPDRPGNPT